MDITDRIYGTIEITNPLIIALINSKPLQRLQHISQDGATHFIHPTLNGNRFEHSVGVWHLSQLYNRLLEEQVACLLHDVPHTAFSHVVDYVMNEHNTQEYHDQFLQQIVLNSDIPAICERHGLDITKVLHKEDYALLDNKLPDLSFDRWDYYMRDAHISGILPLETIQLIVKSVKLKDNQLYFVDAQVAGLLSAISIMNSQLVYNSASSYGAYFLLASALKIALEQNILSETDLFSTDDAVWTKLTTAHNKEIKALIARLQPGRDFTHVPKSEAEFYGTNKARYLDPLVMHDGTLKRTSELVAGLQDCIKTHKERHQHVGVKQYDA